MLETKRVPSRNININTQTLMDFLQIRNMSSRAPHSLHQKSHLPV